MSLDVKKDVIFNTFNGLEEQLSDPDPVKEVRNYRWALRQQTILFQNFLNEMRLEEEAIKQRLERKICWRKWQAKWNLRTTKNWCWNSSKRNWWVRRNS